VNIQNAPTLAAQTQPAVQLSATATLLAAAGNLDPTTTVGTPTATQPPVLIPVTGADLSAEQTQRLFFIARSHQLQSGMNFLGLGLMLIGMVLMGGKKKED
jgi:hypothetical protein